ncbi:hypothetical protein SAMN02800687_0501 [Curtobacterium sp. UNCCL20]|uniref:DUF6841 family protein n=1 Tax=Curtobacterium sp. UNCCL20 TaxID=1502773 RepID=UPI0008836702|nr:hypothetical protein [Curtobacterium sp. UNCCL20]SDQ13582.1 hypothetical protein SAMN02800687_0501 [Curtobacterium sp. UNCCL20]
MHDISHTTRPTAELTEWFFDDYLPAWTGAALRDDPAFIGAYWASPLWVGDDHGAATLMPDDNAVRQWAAGTFARLRDSGYARTEVLDRRVVAHTTNGGTVEVLWSRVRHDGTEIERLAVHFTVMRTQAGIRAVAIQALGTDASTL